MKSLRSIEVLRSPQRESSLDALRGISILLVVLWHSDTLFYGFIGVDFFFVLSGFLVSRILLRPFLRGEPISFLKFFVSRAFKIWPSYYVFIILGQGVAYLLYRHSHPDQIIPWSDLPMYLFFYRNYRGNYHWSFDHLWSICVEEHFYILLPLFFILIQRFFKSRVSVLITSVIFIILLGIVAKQISLVRFETYSGTQNRIDALGWGVLLSILDQVYGLRVRNLFIKIILISLSTLGIILSNWYLYSTTNSFLNEVVFHSVIPFAFAIILLSLLDVNFTRVKITHPLRYFSYYSYNWYLWHVMAVTVLHDKMPQGPLRTFIFLAVTFSTAVLATIFVEEPFLKMRSQLSRIRTSV